MNRELLYRFFEGNATFDEENQIRDWVESSVDNFSKFFQERKTYDTLLLANSPSLNKKREKPWYYSLGMVGSAAAVIVALLVGGLYLFSLNDGKEQYNTILVPPGQRINLILSDNTNLWLNANTKFRYPAKFAKKDRTVYLDGEAYFEVNKDAGRPFIVKTTRGDVRVTGTAFNIEAYSRYGSFNTSLFKGGVDIYRDDKKLVSLHPDEKSTLENNKLLISRITDPDTYLWRDGLIAFKNKELEEILDTLEKYFAVDIQVTTGALPQHTYTGKFRQSDGVDYALRVLQKSIRFVYERDDETGTIYIK